MSYRRLESNAFSDDSTWINLGLWTQPNSTFTQANQALAFALASLVNPNAQCLIDMGCGNGDAIGFFVEKFHFPQVIGVNSNSKEYLACFSKFQFSPTVQLVFSDAIEYLENQELKHMTGNAALVCVDAVYHFAPSRVHFISSLTHHRSNIKSLAMSDIVLSEKWSREKGRLDFITEFVRYWMVRLVAWASGTPKVNLDCTLEQITHQLNDLGWQVTYSEVVTNQVFEPFSNYCMGRAQNQPWYSKTTWILISSALFMRFLGWTGAVDFVVYAAKRE
ncbi:hypothetical protein BASA81_004409 [Batrachochytrium salamandrivorans]|nr:hypothetical protein BASA81_004409 [Batrachochytrium salamandrivorans]